MTGPRYVAVHVTVHRLAWYHATFSVPLGMSFPKNISGEGRMSVVSDSSS